MLNARNSFFAPLTCKTHVATIGAAVIDTHVAPQHVVTGEKSDDNFQDVLGGGAANSARVIQTFGLPVKPTLLVGEDAYRAVAEGLVEREFASATILPVLEETRRSYISEGRAKTLRSPIVRPSEALSAAVLQNLSTANVVLIAPLTIRDTDFALNLLRTNPRSILQLSQQQCRDHDVAFCLAERAWLTVINDHELHHLAGSGVRRDRIERVLNRGCRNLLVTHSAGVDANVEGRRLSRERYAANSAGSVIGTGDAFLGGLVSGIVADLGFDYAISLGLAAAKLHAEGREITFDAARQVLNQVHARPAPVRSLDFQVLRTLASYLF